MDSSIAFKVGSVQTLKKKKSQVKQDTRRRKIKRDSKM